MCGYLKINQKFLITCGKTQHHVITSIVWRPQLRASQTNPLLKSKYYRLLATLKVSIRNSKNHKLKRNDCNKVPLDWSVSDPITQQTKELRNPTPVIKGLKSVQ